MRNDLRTRLRAQVADAVRALHEERRVELVGILLDCGVDVHSIARHGSMWRDEEGLHLDRYLRTEDGRIRHEGDDPLTEEFVVRPEWIPDWVPFA